MEIHLKFKHGEQREFLLKVAEKSYLSTENLAKIVKISSRDYRDWLREKYSISFNAAQILNDNFDIPLPEDKDTLVNRWRNAKVLAGKRGGYACFKKHGSPGTLEGRRKGGSKALALLRQKGVIPQAKTFSYPKEFSPELAEFVGILLGDGGITKSQCIITLSREADKDYIQVVSDMGERLFGEKPKIYKRKSCKADELCYNGIRLIEYLVSIGLKIGNKVKQQVGVPEWIMENEIYRHRCVRGLMDTDGCIALHRYKVGGKIYEYKKLNFTNHSLPLILFMEQVFKDLGFTPKLAGKLGKNRLWLYNCAEVQKYLEIIGSSNTRLLRFKESGPGGKAQVR